MVRITKVGSSHATAESSRLSHKAASQLVFLKITSDIRFISLKKVQPNSLKIIQSETNLPMMTQYSFMR
jgi:hypothetical protein